jgi:CRISPR-associated exonuclease Cas4
VPDPDRIHTCRLDLRLDRAELSLACGSRCGSNGKAARQGPAARLWIQLLPDAWVDDIRDEEARVVAECCGRLIGNVTIRHGETRPRLLSAGDIALLTPTKTELWRYERALEEAGLPFSSQAGKNLLRRQEAQDLVALVRTLVDSRDTLALGALLRGPLVGLTEQELLDIAGDLPLEREGAR